MQARDGGTHAALLGLAVTLGALCLVCSAAAAQGHDEERDEGAPAPVHYPRAAPAGQNTYHWRDYTRTELRTGSVADARWDSEHGGRDAAFWRAHERLEGDDERDLAEPAPVHYPVAAPAGEGLFHWNSYRRDELVPGSATEAREQRDRRRRTETGTGTDTGH